MLIFVFYQSIYRSISRLKTAYVGEPSFCQNFPFFFGDILCFFYAKKSKTQSCEVETELAIVSASLPLIFMITPPWLHCRPAIRQSV